MSKAKRRQITVGKTKVTRAPWEEDRYIYDVKVGNDGLFDSNMWIAIVQLIVGIVVFMWIMNSMPDSSTRTKEEVQIENQRIQQEIYRKSREAGIYTGMDN